MIHDDMICKYDTKAKSKAKLKRKTKARIQDPKLSKLKREANSKLSSQASKLGLVKMFSEDICELVMDVNMNKVNVPFLIVVLQEMKTGLYVLGFGVENGVFGYTYGTGAITEQRHSPKL
jgi:hypothetical protein